MSINGCLYIAPECEYECVCVVCVSVCLSCDVLAIRQGCKLRSAPAPGDSTMFKFSPLLRAEQTHLTASFCLFRFCTRTESEKQQISNFNSVLLTEQKVAISTSRRVSAAQKQACAGLLQHSKSFCCELLGY